MPRTDHPHSPRPRRSTMGQSFYATAFAVLFICSVFSGAEKIGQKVLSNYNDKRLGLRKKKNLQSAAAAVETRANSLAIPDAPGRVRHLEGDAAADTCFSEKCHDDALFVSSIGTNCTAHSLWVSAEHGEDCLTKWLADPWMQQVYSSDNLFHLIVHCPCVCNVECDVDMSASTTPESSTSSPAIPVVTREQPPMEAGSATPPPPKDIGGVHSVKSIGKKGEIRHSKDLSKSADDDGDKNKRADDKQAEANRKDDKSDSGTTEEVFFTDELMEELMEEVLKEEELTKKLMEEQKKSKKENKERGSSIGISGRNENEHERTWDRGYATKRKKLSRGKKGASAANTDEEK